MYATYPSLAGRRVIITGGATGIGAAMVRQFAAQGARVAIYDMDAASGTKLAANTPDLINFSPVDVTDIPALTTAVAATAGELGGIDVLITNAANDTRHTLDELTPELWDSCLAVNLKHQFFAAKAAYPYLRASRGSVLCLGSLSWLNGTTGMIGYSTAKSGVQGLVRTLARLWGQDGIRVNALVPGWTMTERQEQLWVDDAAKREIDRQQSLKSLLMPDDVARTALFLASDDSAMITRQSIIIDGGWV